MSRRFDSIGCATSGWESKCIGVKGEPELSLESGEDIIDGGEGAWEMDIWVMGAGSG